eukprot:SM001348S26850  [mRNA]  locus=s1348:80:417:+ [translate_table: standard]
MTATAVITPPTSDTFWLHGICFQPKLGMPAADLSFLRRRVSACFAASSGSCFAPESWSSLSWWHESLPIAVRYSGISKRPLRADSWLLSGLA